MAKDKRLLVVEDDEAIRVLLFTILRRRGFHVDTAPHGRSALDRLQECRYALILLDLMMPVMSGYEFLDELETLPAGERPIVIVLTAGMPPAGLKPGIVVGTIRKPFDLALLIDTVSACLTTAEELEQREPCPSAESDRDAAKDPSTPAN